LRLAFGDLDPPGERAEMVAAFKADALEGAAGEFAQHLRRDRLTP